LRVGEALAPELLPFLVALSDAIFRAHFATTTPAGAGAALLVCLFSSFCSSMYSRNRRNCSACSAACAIEALITAEAEGLRRFLLIAMILQSARVRARGFTVA
jgi:hypothetical protein